jgi:hypothetical protein
VSEAELFDAYLTRMGTAGTYITGPMLHAAARLRNRIVEVDAYGGVWEAIAPAPGLHAAPREGVLRMASLLHGGAPHLVAVEVRFADCRHMCVVRVLAE